MTVLVAVADQKEGAAALQAAVAEARLLGTDLVVVNLSVPDLDVAGLPADVAVTVTDRQQEADPVEAVLDEIAARDDAQRLVIGLRRRSPIGKAILGSVSQRLLLESPIPVLAVKSA